MTSSTSTPGEHLAVILPQKDAPMSISLRPTPEPGPNDILIEVKAIAVNIADYYQRDQGIPPIPQYPTVLGSDVAGIVVKVGSNVSADAPQPGARVTAFASAFFENGLPDYGAFHLSFEEAAMLPMAVLTAWDGWYVIGIPHDTKYTPEDKKAMLVWGASSSVGSAALQSAKIMGFTVYTTASARHHEYLKQLGADRTFDYKDADVVAQIIQAARDDGVSLHNAYDAVAGSLEPTMEILKELKGDAVAKIAHAALLPPDAPTVEGIEAKFVYPPLDPVERQEYFHQTFRVWLTEKLASGQFIPSPHIQIMGGGLEGLNKALDALQEGVSGTKIVLTL
ncbi:hypothetical protein P175DRAFT_0512856 [Aspergillus ochraceoroseus IBT 24754]|uniref:Enoyl reductase (ER) domain-containing protein n=2 Tax=Aspergillus ochraceoroseus TaxID=138278 RepID=A0A2T5M565_9EURO|nr:uncharacterized protein P175DRAFT_0512856 [Aspergillus ochraceoroseus IBT 24754]KKK21442.1 hypothetical protein AOCH_000130 [Aspergillus ochraceoroseus]PTU23688.1 hypothetical protein P175DRAFT_0512856 [Aspergillus ochraceoroseus IBT 24754]